MKRAQSTFLFLLIGGVVAAVLLARPASNAAGQNGSRFPLLGVRTPGESATSEAAAAPSTLPAPQQPSGAAALPTPIGSSPAAPPPAGGVYASELGTLAPGGASVEGDGPSEGWRPPPMAVPIAHHPWDHYWFSRPVGSNNNNFGLPYYGYGSDGPANDLRIHHGIDLANPIGVEVYAGSDGTVVWAGKGSINEFEAITAYGNTVVILHDFGYDGLSLYTLYAHMSALLVSQDQHVTAGQLIGLIGATGQVSGPHVHFEVRVGYNRYSDTRNPDLWLAPYTGTGTIAGRITLADGQPVYDAGIAVIDLATGDTVYETTTYSGLGINSDDHWGENFAAPNIPVGRYLVTARHDSGSWSGSIDVLEGVTNWVEMVISASVPPTSTETP